MIKVTQAGRQVMSEKIPVWLIREISTQIPKGKIIGLVGPNGAGKTTLMRLIAGLDELSEGDISVDGRPVRSASLSIGYLNEQAGLYHRLTVRENLLYQASLYHLPAHKVNRKIEELATALNISDLLGKNAGKLSRGEGMKVLIARTLLHDPEYLLLDEPTNGLDLSAVINLRKFLKNLASDKQHGILISSHAMHEVQKLADYLVVIHQGRLLMQGTTQDICLLTQSDNLEAAFAKLVYQITDIE